MVIKYLQGLVVAGLIALGGAGGATVAMNLHSGSPRLLHDGIASAVIGILGGGLLLALKR